MNRNLLCIQLASVPAGENRYGLAGTFYRFFCKNLGTSIVFVSMVLFQDGTPPSKLPKEGLSSCCKTAGPGCTGAGCTFGL